MGIEFTIIAGSCIALVLCIGAVRVMRRGAAKAPPPLWQEMKDAGIDLASLSFWERLSEIQQWQAEEPMTPRQAAALAFISMTNADGETDESEFQALLHIAGDFETLKWAIAKFGQSGRGALKFVPVVARFLVSPRQRKAVYLNLVDIATTNGVVDPQEEALLERYREVFEIDEGLVAKASRVLQAKNARHCLHS